MTTVIKHLIQTGCLIKLIICQGNERLCYIIYKEKHDGCVNEREKIFKVE